MTPPQADTLFHRLRRVVRPEPEGGLSDAQLLQRFADCRDEAAFELLVWRHGTMVHGLARRLLRREHDAEDVFQATFLILARKAAAVRRPEALASWLYRIAYRLACRVRARGSHTPLSDLADLPAPPAVDEAAWRELRAVLDEEVERRPEKYRLPVILCYLEGRTLEQAGRCLSCPRGTVSSRLAVARERLRSRLTRRGVTLSTAALSAALTHGAAAAAPAPLVAGALTAALPSAAAPAALTPAAVLAEGVLRAMFLTRLTIALTVCLAVGAAAGGTVVWAWQAPAGEAKAPTARLVPGVKDTLRLVPTVPPQLGLQVAEVKPRAATPFKLRLVGTLNYDSDRLFTLRSRFPGEIVEIARIGQGARNRPLRYGDSFKKGELLAVVWSKDLAQKKADYFDALLQLNRDRERLARLQKLFEEGAVPLATLRQAEREVQVAMNKANAAERTLRLWRLEEAEIQAVKTEAQRSLDAKLKPDPERDRRWARVEIRAPADGTLVEMDLALGQIVDANTLLLRLADLSKLEVWVEPPEDCVAALWALPPAERRWTIELQGDPKVAPIQGHFDRITAAREGTPHILVVGIVANPKGRLLVGQFLTVTILLPVPPGEVAIPAAALVDVGKEAIVFVQPDPQKLEYVQRRVAVVRRGRDVVHVRAALRPEEARQGVQALRPGERVVTAGAVELQAVLTDLQARPK